MRDPNKQVIYNIFDYKVYLRSQIELSKKYFTYNGVEVSYTKFPRILITNYDFRTVEDSGGTLGYLGLKDAYPNFVDFVTGGMYPSTENIAKMTDMRKRINELSDSNHWTNTSDNSRVMKVYNSEYSEIGLNYVKDKRKYNDFFNYHALKVDSISKDTNKYKIIKNSDNNTEVYVNNGIIQLELESYLSSLETNKYVIDINTYNGFNIVEYDSGSNAHNILSKETLSNTFTSNDIIKVKRGISKNVGINNNFKLVCGDVNHDISIHNTGDREVYDCCYINDTGIVSIGNDNGLV